MKTDKVKAQENLVRAKSNWYVWLFPVFAVIICAWLLFQFWHNRGPKIRISFDDASSIQAEKTSVRYRGVVIGMVKKVSVSEDQKEALVEINLQKDAEDFAVEGSKFWIVTPKVGLQGVTGLETIFEGAYIAVQPGKPDNNTKLDFKANTGKDMTESFENTSVYSLEARDAESVTQGDSVTFRGLTIGTITEVNLAKNGQSVLMQIRIQNRYKHLIRINTVFWRKIGVQAKLGLFGSEVKVNSLDSIMHGGVELFTPDSPGERAKALTKFILYSGPPKGYEKWNPKLD